MDRGYYCNGRTATGKRCFNRPSGSNIRCHLHIEQSKPRFRKGVRCTGKTVAGGRCKNDAKPYLGLYLGKCSIHTGEAFGESSKSRKTFTTPRCKSYTAKGNRCKNARPMDYNFCSVHGFGNHW